MRFIPSGSTFLIQISSIIFLHAAYSAWEARGFAKEDGIIIPTTFGSPVPLDIIIQTLISFILLILGVNWSTPPLKDISWASEMRSRSIDSEDSRLGFKSMRHRGRLLFSKES